MFIAIDLLFKKRFTIYTNSEDSLDEGTHAQLVHASNLITVERLEKLAFVYGKSNGPSLAHHFSQLFYWQPKYQRDLEKFIQKIQSVNFLLIYKFIYYNFKIMVLKK
jgi:hypothetical protein